MLVLTYRSSPSTESTLIVIPGQHEDNEIAVPHNVYIHEAEAIWRVDFPEMCSIPGCEYHTHLIGPASQPVPVPEPPFILAMSVGILVLWCLRVITPCPQ